MKFRGSEMSSADLTIVITPKLGTPAKWNYDPQWIYKKIGALRLELARKIRRQTQALRANRHRRRLQILLGH